uniref:Uncharacterized protein n=1 Tax=Arundo donax TaxID=35708 RepID=A0A0A9BDV0_ARUDO
MAPNCPMVKENKGLRLCAYGLPGQMFYNLHMALNEEDRTQRPLPARLLVREGLGSVEKVTTELRYLISSTWDWKVKRIEKNEYQFEVPSKESLEMLTKFDEFRYKSSDMKVKVEKLDEDVGCFAVLRSVWVKALGFPPWARKENAVKEVAYLVGDPEEVDKRSLSGNGPVRVKVSIKDPQEIKGTSNVFFNGKGFKISWFLEQDNTEGEVRSK